MLGVRLLQIRGDDAMRILILGGDGMLGHKAFQVFAPVFETWATVRSSKERLQTLPNMDSTRLIVGIEARSFDSVSRIIGEIRPDVIVNCIGIVKQLKDAESHSTTIAINALFPHLLSERCSESGIRLVQISTDCVFSGKKGNYDEDSEPDATDLYGRSKLLGEVIEKNSVTLRTSMIGREIERSSGLVEWFLGQKGGRVQGYRCAIFSGFTTKVLATIIRDIILHHPDLTGLYHVSSEPINKFDLLCMMREAIEIDVEIEPYDDFFCDRSLNSSRFRRLTGFQPPSWPRMIEDLALEASDYEFMRNTR